MKRHNRTPVLGVRLWHLEKMRTIDRRADYPRPVTGEHYIATVFVLCSGRKVALTGRQRHNHQVLRIPVGTYTDVVNPGETG